MTEIVVKIGTWFLDAYERAYLERNKNETISEKFIHQKIFDLFPETEAKTFWQTIKKNEAHFNDQDDQHLIML